MNTIEEKYNRIEKNKQKKKYNGRSSKITKKYKDRKQKR